jgi:hypothetical protein
MTLDLANRRLRASGAFVLVGFDELEAAEQQRLSSLREDRDFFGLLKPVNALLPAKSVSKEAALLLLTLQRPQRIPALLASMFGEDDSPLRALVADGVLEVEHEGTFVSGHDALRLFRVAARATPPLHRASSLSSEAIECAASYEGLDVAALARKVYAFGRQPCTGAIRARFARDTELLSFLAADPAVADLLAEEWAADPDAQSPWLSWSTRRPSPRLGYKLYVSARLDGMPCLFGMALRALKRTRCDRFKIGRRGEGVCRPDKMVAYFASLEQLRACAGLIEGELETSDLPPGSAHGVPFTAPIDPAGFLTWGMDPPRPAGAPGVFPAESWRGWLASRVAIAVLAARGAGGAGDVVSFVRERIALDGVDPTTWTPAQAIWRNRAADPRDVA